MEILLGYIFFFFTHPHIFFATDKSTTHPPSTKMIGENKICKCLKILFLLNFFQ